MAKQEISSSSRTPLPSGRATLGLNFWLLWLLVTIVGYGLGLSMGFPLGTSAARAIPESLFGPVILVAFGAVSFTIVGLAVGAMQWLLLRRHLSQSAWWIVASAAGWGLGTTLGTASPLLGYSAWVLLLLLCAFGPLPGLFVGFLQWLVLRHQVIRAGLWVLASGLGWTTAFIVGLALHVFGPMESFTLGMVSMGSFPLQSLLPAVAIGSVGGGITGLGIVWLLRHPVEKK